MARPDDIPVDTKREARTLSVVIASFFSVLLLWGWLAELDSGAIASGEVIPAGKVRTVQHLDGGMIKAIRVKDGDHVGEGDELVLLDDTDARAAMDIARKELAGLEARLADARKEESHWQARAKSVRQMLDNAEEESRINKNLFDQNFISRPRLLQLQNQTAQSAALYNENAAELARARQKVSEFDAMAAAARDRLGVARERLARTHVAAPQAGIVHGVRVTTIGGVIAPGAVLLDVVPESEELLVEARVSPDDIDVVIPGLPAHVRLTAYKARSHIRLLGKVIHVSGTTFRDEGSQGKPYYKARVAIGPEELRKIESGMLTPGMLAEVDIVAGKRSAMRYLFDPVIDSMRRAFHES